MCRANPSIDASAHGMKMRLAIARRCIIRSDQHVDAQMESVVRNRNACSTSIDRCWKNNDFIERREIEAHVSSIASKRFATLFELHRATSIIAQRASRSRRDCARVCSVEASMRGFKARVESLDRRAIRVFTRAGLLHDWLTRLR
jgi:hypothetical protein